MKSFLTLLLSLTVTFSMLPNISFAKEKQKSNSQLVNDVKSAILIEKDTGKILYEKNMNEELPPASMTKIMTLLLIFKALDDKQITLNDKVTTSEHAASMGGSQVFLEPGEEMTVNDMLKAITIGSANDASVAMAEYIAGSEDEFVKRMNAMAKKLGLKHTHFNNPTGLPVDNHYSSAHDMAVMARALLQYQDVLKYTSKYEDYLRENTDNKFWLVNTNKLVKTYPGVDGLKTGYTNKAKYCLTATAQKNGMRVIAVVMGAPTSKDRNKQVAKMLNYAFANYKTQKIMDKNQVVDHVRVDKGHLAKTPVVTKTPVVLLMKKGAKPGQYIKKVTVNKKITAPIKAGTVVGDYTVSSDGKVLSKTPLVVKNNVHIASWWTLFKRVTAQTAKWPS